MKLSFLINIINCFDFTVLRKFVLVPALICLGASATSCRSYREIEIVHDSIMVHDTTSIMLIDTVITKEITYDSVDRYIEKIMYVDTNGVIHEKEIEHLTKIITIQKEEYQNTIDEQLIYISELEKKLNNSNTIKEVEKSLTWYQKTLMYAGVAFFFEMFALFAYMLLNKKRKD